MRLYIDAAVERQGISATVVPARILATTVYVGGLGLVVIYAIYFIWRYVPETKGLTLEEITALLTATSNGAHSSRE